MSGGMRVDAKQLPLRYQEQLGAAILAKITQTPPVAVREEVSARIERHVQKYEFVNHRAATRFRILSKQAASGAICELLCHKNDKGLIDCFTYTVKEEF